MDSIWQSGAAFPPFPQLMGDCKTDVLIIGGGMAGILCAHALAQDGVDTVLVEANALGHGVTGSTTAKITAQHGAIYHTLLHRFGTERAKQYLRANLEAVDAFRTLAEGIPCHFADRPAILYSSRDPRPLLEELEALEQLDAPAQWVSELPLPFPTAGGVSFPNQAQFHPLEFLSAIVRPLRVYQNTRVLELGDGWARTEHGTIHGKAIIIATHFPILNKHGSYFLKLYQSRSYVLALGDAPELDGMYLDCAPDGLSLRSQASTLLLGGFGGRTGKGCGGWDTLAKVARNYYPAAPILRRWATQDCMSLDGVPYVGRYSTRTPNLYVATGFNKWGMTGSMAAALLLRDLVQGRENPYADLFSPSRTVLRPQLAVNAVHAVKNLLTPGRPRCPHMGCLLKWNPQERTWDCPCHGSRFLPDGACVDNPATGDLPNPPPEP